MVEEKRQVDFDALGTGLVLIIVGTALMLNHPYSPSGWVRVLAILWPIQIVAWGFVRMMKGRQRGYRAGGWTMFAGVWILFFTLGLVRGQMFWPILATAIGVGLMWKAIVPASTHTGVQQ